MANALNLVACSNDEDMDEALKYSEDYIVKLARKKVPRAIIPKEVLDLEIDELAQSTRIKLWNALRHRNVINVKAYINTVVHNSCIDLIRERERVTPLVIDGGDEAYQGATLIATSEGMQDPAYEFEHKRTLADSVEQTVQHIVALPPRQQQAMICSLKEHVDDLLQLTKTFKDYGVDISQVQWPKEREELQRTRAALSTARKKLRHSSIKDLPIF